MRIGIDTDGVLYRFPEAVHRAAVAYGYAVPPLVVRSWSFHEDWGWDLATFLQVFDRGVDDGIIFGEGEPYPGAATALRRLRQAGHSVHIVTTRSNGSPGIAERNTRAWLARFDLSYDTLTFTPDKTSVPTDVFIDDVPHRVSALEAAGVPTWMPWRPWNSHVEHPRRVRGIDQFAAGILAGSITA